MELENVDEHIAKLESAVDVQKFTFNGMKFIAKCVKVYDGDTIHVIVDLPYFGIRDITIRMYGYDTDEIRGGTVESKQSAIEQRDYLKSLILNKFVYVVCLDFDKYGRILANVFIIDETHTVGTCVNKIMVDGGCKEYFGRQ
jgi:endonuclease YncB( thermonuclease family)